MHIHTLSLKDSICKAHFTEGLEIYNYITEKLVAWIWIISPLFITINSAILTLWNFYSFVLIIPKTTSYSFHLLSFILFYFCVQLLIQKKLFSVIPSFFIFQLFHTLMDYYIIFLNKTFFFCRNAKPN